MPKPSSGRKRKGVEIPFANSIKEANELAVQYGLAEKANFAGLDILAANEMIQYLNLTRNDFPDAFDKLEFMGSIKAFRKEFRNKYKLHASGSPFACCAFPPDSKKGSFLVNEKLFSSKMYDLGLYDIQQCEKELFHPIGCNTLKSIIDHEIGHLINRKYDISHQNKVVHSLFWKYQGKTADKMMNVLSKYANKNISEFVSEAWSEYRNNPQPREVAKTVGREIIKLMKKK